MEMRELVFLVADSTMQQTLEGFFGRAQFHRNLGCAAFPIDARANRDVFVAAGENDPGLYKRADETLSRFRATHRRAVVMLDADWDGSPGAAAITAHVEALVQRVWAPGDVGVIVPDPEIEAWFWLPDSPHVATAMRYRGSLPYREVLAGAGHWPEGAAKPPRPKEALEYLRFRHGTDFSPAVRRRAAERVSVARCADPAFLTLRDMLRRWFPAEDR